MNSNVKTLRQFSQKPKTKPRLSNHEAFIKAAEILLTEEGFNQIQELAEAFSNPTTGASA